MEKLSDHYPKTVSSLGDERAVDLINNKMHDLLGLIITRVRHEYFYRELIY